MSGPRFRLAIVTSHAIQYRAPLFRRLAAEPWLDLEVLYCHDYGIRPQPSGWGVRDFKWDGDLESGYRHRLLRNLSPRPQVSTFTGEINPELAAILFGRRFDAVLLEGWHTITALAGIVLGNVAPTPVILQCEATLATRPRSPLRGLLKPFAMRALLRAPAAFLAIGTKNRELYRHHGVPDERIFSFPYTVDVAHFVAEAERFAGERARLRSALGFRENDTVFLFVGQAIPRKDPLGLLAAFRELRARRDDVGLVVVGSGPQLERLRAEAASIPGARVEGFKNQGELPPYYTLADVFVLPSLEETWGLVVNEAMCFGLPVITTPAMGATHDLVEGRSTGLVVSPRNTAELCAAMTQLAEDPARRRAMGQRARELIGRWTYEEDVAGLRAAVESLRVGR
jgi:glycosyltransferase involved in cell wall biosynthesis